MRNRAFRPFHLLGHFAGIRIDGLLRREFPIGGADERLGEIDRIGDDADQRQKIAVANPVLHQRGAIAARNSIPADVALLEMRGGDGELIAFPFSGRESLPGVRLVFGWMRTAIHPDGSFLGLPLHVRVVGDHLLRLVINVLPNSQIGRAARSVVGWMGTALPLRQRRDGCIPTVRAKPGCIRDGQAQIVAEFRTGDSLGLVFVIARPPLAGEIVLGKQGKAQ